MVNFKGHQEPELTGLSRCSKGRDVYMADATYFIEQTGSPCVDDWKVWVAQKRRNNTNLLEVDSGRKAVANEPLYRWHPRTEMFYHIDAFRFRDTKRGNEYIPFYGPDLQDKFYEQATTRKQGNKNSNYDILSLMYHGERDGKLKCLVCSTHLNSAVRGGYRLGLRGDFHHMVVLSNKSYWKGSTDPSKRLESTKLQSGQSAVSQDCLQDFMGCAPLCKSCHADIHSFIAKRCRATKHSDIRDYEPHERPHFLQNEANYDAFAQEMQKVHGYPQLPTYSDWMLKMHLPAAEANSLKWV